MSPKSKKAHTQFPHKLSARPDTPDFRDKMYVPTLVEVPSRISLEEYKECKVPVLDQGKEGACTGFGLAAVAHYLLLCRKIKPDSVPVSPKMFYEMAKRYDEWPGDDYEGSSARGAMKGWHKHGVCSEVNWEMNVSKKDNRLTDERAKDAATRPLGAYFRVNHKDLVSMHSAMAEVGILYATCVVHQGWYKIGKDGVIPFDERQLGGHAFAIVAYDERGFWIQNSWGKKWGLKGFAMITYDDWLKNATDVWVARLGVPVVLKTPEAAATVHSAAARHSETLAFSELRPHIISIGNDGLLRERGTYGTSESDVQEILKTDFKRITAGWEKKRLLLYAHGGLVDETSAIQRVADYRSALLQSEVYPLAFIWKTDFWTTITNILKDSLSKRRPEGILDASKDFMLDRLDDLLEPLAQVLGGKSLWDEMKENALKAMEEQNGGGRIALKYIAELLKEDPEIELHVAGHSAGSIFHARIIQALTSQGSMRGSLKGITGLGARVASCTLWAPAVAISLFEETYLPAIRSGSVGRFTLFTLTDKAEQDDNCGYIYNKSLLYLVSNALEKNSRIPLFRDGEPVLGMEKFIRDHSGLIKHIKDKKIDWVQSPNKEEGGDRHSTACRHGDFDDDLPTVRSTLARILNIKQAKGTEFVFSRSASSLRKKRSALG